MTQLNSFADITEERLAKLGFANPARASTILVGLAGNDVPDSLFEALLRLLGPALEASPDPDRALGNLDALLANVGSRSTYYRLLEHHPRSLADLLLVLASSQFLSDLLIKTPEYFEVLANPQVRDRSRDVAGFFEDARRRMSIAKTLGAKQDALRRFKPPEVLRIGARDILGLATVEQTVAEISDFAQATVMAAVSMAEAEHGFAVIGMGKLGGRELNYASDIDLIFVHADSLEQSQANKLGELVRDTLAKSTDAGMVFRVDLRLRPEGRFGPISRSVSACKAYYESWAENWERQALLKARFIAGDSELGREFLRIAEAFTYPKRVPESFVDDIRTGKRLIDKRVARAGEAATNVKEGYGAIRDIEFAVQLLQLVAGGANPQLRRGSTLESLDTLAANGLIANEERDVLRESYLFLRNVEHRLQIMDERPVRILPARNEREMRLFARRLGYPDAAHFLTDYWRHTQRVHTLCEQMFYGEDLDAHAVGVDTGLRDLVLAADDEVSQRIMGEHLRSLGFKNVAAAVELIKRSELGSEYGGISPDAKSRFAELAPALITAAAGTSDPDTALAGIDSLALEAPSQSALYRSLLDSPELLRRLCSLCANSTHLWHILVAHMEFLDLLNEPSQLLEPAVPAVCKDEETITSMIRRERLRIGAADIWGLLSVPDVMQRMTALADSALASALCIAGPDNPQLAVIGLGKLGGAELTYSSDLDVVWVATDDAYLTQATEQAEAAMRLLREGLKPWGVSWKIDARLRPDGRQGRLVRTVDDYKTYYKRDAQTWEKQALLKARYVAGNEVAGKSLVDVAVAITYGSSLTSTGAEEMRHMKHRIETERAKDPSDIKLGPGGLSDVEWTCQMLQLRHGSRWRSVRSTNTLGALQALRDDALITQADWETLDGGYRRLVALRNKLWLADGRGTDRPAKQAEDLVGMRQRVREVFERLFLV